MCCGVDSYNDFMGGVKWNINYGGGLKVLIMCCVIIFDLIMFICVLIFFDIYIKVRFMFYIVLFFKGLIVFVDK